MTKTPADPIRPTDDEARALARRLIAEARHGALGVIDPATGAPMVTRIAVVPGADGVPLTLVSTLSSHTAALDAEPACSLLLGEPGGKGDPLTHPRLTLQCRAEAADKTALRAHYLRHYPKAELYYDFGDFRLLRLDPVTAFLNGGFGKAYRMQAGDLAPD
ncbi:pyridoxamine 5'-phosphate oxidase family protein [Roseibacterium sp. SDUM158017]|uniref:HugZ family pyridoxamine 5'-phosphate oxidase n=1 Tax=Roseicyclus salinarum TaxID=3036773 RepID=UPI002414F1F7|nr:pyridoxamine 5'-phosphate oxidase family protein [Roseibacterium sp. SDUM158017]MDG4647966.1 pyridoxamine 5'-phosphate oxidase family protein [Roseibacterium sp. SDUM158017]